MVGRDRTYPESRELLVRPDYLVDSVSAYAQEPHLTACAGGNAFRGAMDEFRRFGHDSVRRDRRELAGAELGEQELVAISRADNGRLAWGREEGDIAGWSDACDLRDKGARHPNVAVRSGCHRGGRTHAGELSDNTVRGDAGELVYRLLGKPHVAVRPGCDVARKRVRRRRRKSRKDSAGEIVPPDGVIGLVGKPDVAIGAGCDAHADAEKGELQLGDVARRGDKGDLSSGAFAEPDIAVWPRRDECRVAQARGPEVADLAMRRDARDLAAVGKSEPEIPVRAHRNVKRLRSFPDRKGSEACLSGCVSTGECEQGGNAETECDKTFMPKAGERCSGAIGLN